MKAIQKEMYSTPKQPLQQEQLPERRKTVKRKRLEHSVSEEHSEEHSEALYEQAIVRVFRYFFSIDIGNENHIGAV